MAATQEVVNTSITEKHFVNDSTQSDIKKEVDIEQVSEISDKPIPPPDGGLKAWLTVFGAFCCFLATQGYGYSWGVYLRQYNTYEYPGNMTSLSWIGSLWYWFCTITGPISMWLASKFSDRLIVGVACILCTLALMFASITNEIWQLYLTQGVMSGLGTSLAWFVCLRNPQQWFDKRRGLAVGLTMSASGVGGLILSNISNACFEAIGYRWALRVLGFIELVALAIGAVTSFRLNPIPKNVPFIDFNDFKNKEYIILFIIHFVGNFAFYMPASFVPSYAQYLELDPWIGTNISAIMAALMFVGKISVGFISDYAGRFNMAVFCGLMACIAHLAVWLTATNAGSMWAFAVLYGIFGGGYIAMITSVIAQVVGVDRVDHGTGWAFFAWSWGGLAAQPACSAIIEMGAGNNYQGAIIYSGVLFFAGACLCWLLRVKRGGWKLLKHV
ncbi:major facilitator superfamily domain-containing protein [Phascolomyces articulosus]|uniref:Major facilitator superfamily domain-containing protein n=1 Tax=Phascolomyces articulosus TaxID=60185 RepID=A0AAD5KC77_9FUNG|nr:major facilitator superfamily domain-containing protein [Phascolomyces articulosus]